MLKVYAFKKPIKIKERRSVLLQLDSLAKIFPGQQRLCIKTAMCQAACVKCCVRPQLCCVIARQKPPRPQICTMRTHQQTYTHACSPPATNVSKESPHQFHPIQKQCLHHTQPKCKSTIWGWISIGTPCKHKSRQPRDEHTNLLLYRDKHTRTSTRRREGDKCH